MTFVTRARARVDRMACPWLIRRDALYEYCRSRLAA
jgi:hypothetical protein